MRRVLLLLIAGLAVVVAGFAAVADVVLPGTQPGEIVNWPLDFDSGGDVQGQMPSDCRSCHGGYVAGLTYEPFDTWAGTMMANSARDPLFWAAVDIANQDAPGVGEFCIRCHSPTAWLMGRSDAPDGSSLTGFPDEPDNDFEGITCAFCHRVYEGPSGTPYTENGQYWVDDGTPSSEPPRRGPYGGFVSAPHPFLESSHHQSSEFCGVCHDLRNPTVTLLDSLGADTGLPFPEQLTYTEWTQSAFANEGTTCQDCHMVPVSGFACNAFTPHRPDIYKHDLAGANIFMMEVLKGEYGAALNRTDSYEYAQAQALDMLQNQSATVVVTAPGNVAVGTSMDVDVRVTNNTGHKLPTAYPEGRRMWLHVVARDSTGMEFFESGAYVDSTATLIEDSQVRIYETKHGIHGGGESFHLVLNNRIYKDTRIPPRGFRPNVETAPLGIDYPVQPDTSLAHWDDATYSIPVPAGVVGPIAVEATLRYQTASREYIEFLRDENTSGPDPHDRNYPNAPSRGQRMYDLWSQYGKSAPVDMVVASDSVAVLMPPDNVAQLQAMPGHNRVRLEWDLPATAVAGMKIYRKAWGDYPEYGGPPALVGPPTWPVTVFQAQSTGWTEVFDGVDSTFVDSGFTNADRDVVHYAAFTYTGAGVFALGGTGSRAQATNYLLADLGEIGVPDAYDGAVSGATDLPVFSSAYGTSAGAPGFDPEADIGPTLAGHGFSIPQPDDVIGFSDLVVFALNFGAVPPAKSQALEAPVVSSRASAGDVRLEIGPPVEGKDATEIPVRIRGAAGLVKALHLELAWSKAPRRVEAVAGPALHAGAAAPFVAGLSGDGAAVLDLAMLGRAAVLGADGLVATLRVAGGGHVTGVMRAEVRDVGGKPLPLESRLEAPTVSSLPARLALSPNVPNPFNPRTSFELALPRAGAVDVAVFDVAGRRIRTLLRGHQSAGQHRLTWTGEDDKGKPVASGVYIYRAVSEGETAHRRMVLVR